MSGRVKVTGYIDPKGYSEADRAELFDDAHSTGLSGTGYDYFTRTEEGFTLGDLDDIAIERE